MDAVNTEKTAASRGPILMAAAAAALLWCSQPPLGIWPLAMLAIVPWLLIACRARRLGRGDYFVIWLAGFCYWGISLQGLRHAHPAIYAGWIALAAYLAVYVPLFVLILRQMLARRLPIWMAAPLAWVGCEWVRNYLLSGISAAMLGHTMADVPLMIQIADLFGSYGVSFVIVSVNVAMCQLLQFAGHRRRSVAASSDGADETAWPAVFATAGWRSSLAVSLVTAGGLLALTLVYGNVRLSEPVDEPLATFALVQRNEQVEYLQDQARDVKIFHNYTRQTLTSLSAAKKGVDAVVWPESMFSGGLPWMIADADAKPLEAMQMTPRELQQVVTDNRDYFLRRARDIQNAVALSSGRARPCHLIVGCGVVHYGEETNVYSGVVHVAPLGQEPPVDWYGKTHLMMFGEYIPLLSRIPGIREYIRAFGMLMTTGPGGKCFSVNDTLVAPNICVETAVERVTVNQLGTLDAKGKKPDVVVTVTNDGWFDDSSVIEHHLRCAQLIAVGCRRPVLSAANNGPTAWIDSCGRIVERLPAGSNGTVFATPLRDRRQSLYLMIGDWPARLLGLLCVGFFVDALWQRRKEKRP